MAHDPHDMDDAEAAAARAGHDAAAREAAWLAMATDPHGQLLVADLLTVTGYLGLSYTPGDPLGTAYNEGKRSVGAFIYNAVMGVAPDRWAEIQAASMRSRSALVGNDG